MNSGTKFFTKNIITKAFLASILIVGALVTWHSIPAMEQTPSHLHILTAEGKATQPLAQLLNFFEIKADNAAQIVKETQATWLRAAGKERWEADDLYADKRDALMALFTQANVVNTVEPQKKEYDYVLVLGALQHRVQNRLDYTATLWNKGIHFKEIVFLGSARTLDTQQEPACLFGQPTPKTEYDMMQWVYEHANLPQSMRAVKATFINTPNTMASNGQVKRATTPDTIHAWLQTNPKPGSLLVISNQPHIGYQSAVVETILPASFSFEAVGQALNADTPTSEILDALARWIYQENKLLEAKAKK